MAIDITKLTLEEILDLKRQLSSVKVWEHRSGAVKTRDYASWDWTKSDRELMEEHGVCRATVSVWRRQLGKQKLRPYRANRQYYGSWDWSKGNTELAKEHGVSVQTVSNWRHILGKPKVTKWSNKAKTWDWSQSNAEIARKNQVDVNVVQKWRAKLGMPPGPRDLIPQPPVIVPKITIDHSQWDWTRPDIEISRAVGLSRERIRQIRAKLGKPKVTTYQVKYQKFLDMAAGRKELLLRQHQEFQLSQKHFRVYCARAGIKCIWTPCQYECRKYPMNLMNWDLPAKLLQDIWKVPDRYVSVWRCNHGIRKAKFRSTKGNYPHRYAHLVWQERRKAEEYFASKQPAVESAATVVASQTAVASGKTSA